MIAYDMTWYRHDPVMTALVKTLPEPKITRKKDMYLALLKSVINQQLSTTVADVIFRRFCDLFENGYPDAETIVTMDIETLRSASLSNAKARYVQNIAAFHLEFPITVRHFSPLSDEEAIAHLTSIKGVGVWTAHMLMMFALGRPDIFPVGDLVIRQTMVNLYKLNETGPALHRRLHAIAGGWKPQRTLASRYLWSARGAKIA